MEKPKEIWTDIYGVKWDSKPPTWMEATRYVRADLIEHHQSKLKDHGDIGSVMTSSPTEKHHVCGLNGFNPMLGDKCNACDES